MWHDLGDTQLFVYLGIPLVLAVIFLLFRRTRNLGIAIMAVYLSFALVGLGMRLLFAIRDNGISNR